VARLAYHITVEELIPLTLFRIGHEAKYYIDERYGPPLKWLSIFSTTAEHQDRLRCHVMFVTLAYGTPWVNGP
jgi:hypothetical protein